jgi:hypothetical protein
MDITTKKIMDKIGVENDNEIIKQKNIILWFIYKNILFNIIFIFFFNYI